VSPTPEPGAGPRETISVDGGDLLEHVKHLIHEGNVRRIAIVHDGHTVMEFPVTVGVVGILAAPWLAAVGAAAALLTDATIEVERDVAEPDAAPV
jgi:Domain of unknown function (DUF4342)